MRPDLLSCAALVALGALLSSCAPAVFVGATTAGGVIAADNRTAGSFIEDEAIEIKATLRLNDEIGDEARYSVFSINRVAMVVGQAPDDDVRNEIFKVISETENVRKVINQVEIGPQIPLTRRASDTLVTTRIKSALLQIRVEDFSSLDVKVITENGVVYLMGLITVDNAALAIDAARNVSGVRQVVQAFEFINPGEPVSS